MNYYTFDFKDILRRLQVFFKRNASQRTDWINPMCILVLSAFSVYAVKSAQSYNQGQQWKMQVFWFGISFLSYMLLSLIDYKIYLRYGHWLYFFCIGLLLALWTPLGQRHFGCLRWLNLKVISIQPSEPAKIGTLVLLCSILARSKIGKLGESSFTVLKVLGISALPIFLIFLQPDLGSALVFPPMIFAILFVSKLPKRFFISFFLVFMLLLAVVAWDIRNYHLFLKKHNLSPMRDLGAYQSQSWVPLKDYQRNRILSFAAPQLIDPKGVGVGWNLRQSLICVGSGGFWGKGYNKGTQAHLGYLPQSVATNDFIFSVFAEEAGFIGSLFVVILYALMVCNGLHIASQARDRFGAYLAVGISTILMMHAFINIGMTIGIMPITGVPLPFLSYGGSFVLSCCILQGLLQSVYRFRKKFS